MSDRDHVDIVSNNDVDHAVREASHLRGTNIGVEQQRIAQRRFGDATKGDIHGFDEASSAPGVILLVNAKICGNSRAAAGRNRITSRGLA
jgi:hypothetical protein